MKKQFQVCLVDTAQKRAFPMWEIGAENITQAYELTPATPEIRIYPFVTLDNPESVTAMAEMALKSFENWERRNNFAVNNPQNRSMWEQEDLTSVAVVSIIEKLTDNPRATMYDVKSTAFSAIASTQKAYERKAEREYNPDFVMCNVQPRIIRPGCPALDALMKETLDAVSGDMSPAQFEVFTLYYNENISAPEIAEKTGKNRRNVYKSLYKAYFRILEKAVELDPGLKAFKKAGYSYADVAETVVTMGKRAGIKPFDVPAPETPRPRKTRPATPAPAPAPAFITPPEHNPNNYTPAIVWTDNATYFNDNPVVVGNKR